MGDGVFKEWVFVRLGWGWGRGGGGWGWGWGRGGGGCGMEGGIFGVWVWLGQRK